MDKVGGARLIPRALLTAILTVTVLWSVPQGLVRAQVLDTSATISISDPRPLAALAQRLVTRYGYVITYEDPRYTYQADLQDVTAEVRKDLDKYHAGRAPRVFAPMVGTLTLSVPTQSQISPQEMERLLNEAVTQQAEGGSGGEFRVVRDGSAFHIAPVAIRDRDGTWIQQGSILDTKISVPTRSWNAYALIQAICAAVGAASHTTVTVGTGLPGLSTLVKFGAENQPAQKVLMEGFAVLNIRATWMLYFGNETTDNSYALNFFPVPMTANGSSASSAAPAPKGSSARTSSAVAVPPPP